MKVSSSDAPPFTADQVMADLHGCFTNLVEQYQKRFYNTAFSILHNRERAEDAVQDTLLKVYAVCLPAPAKERQKYLTPNWIYSCVANQAKNNLRREMWLVLFDWSTVPFMTEQSSRLDFTERMVIYHESVFDLQTLINELPPQQAQVIYLRYFKGYSYDEISQLLGQSPDVLRQQVHRCLKRLMKRVIEIKLTPKDVAMGFLAPHESDRLTGDVSTREILLEYLYRIYLDAFGDISYFQFLKIFTH